MLDAALQCVALLAGADESTPSGRRNSSRAGRGTARRASSPRLPIRSWSASPALRRSSGEAKLVADVVITDPDGEVLIELHRVQFRPITPARPVLE